MRDLDETETAIMRDIFKYLKRNRDIPKLSESDSFFEHAAKEIASFAEYYKNHPLAVEMGIAAYNYLEKLVKENA